MLLARTALYLLAAAAASAGADDIYQRLRLALTGTGLEERAAIELSNRNFDQVDTLLAKQAPPSNASRAELLSVRGAVAFLAGNMNAAAADFANAAKLATLNDADVFTEAMALVNLGDNAASGKLLQQLAEKHPERPIYVYWLGKLAYDSHRYEEAAEKLQKAVTLDPKSPRAWDSLGLTFDMQGFPDQAHEAFEKAVVLNRQQTHPSPWPPHNLGYWLLRTNRTREAEQALRESLRYGPTLAQSHYHLGRTLEKEGRETEAVSEYLTATNSDPKSTDACYSLAILYRKLHRNADADAMFAEYKKRRQELPHDQTITR
ncbi:MAG: Cytochrome c biosis factor [Bryobacterales bacterium]|nr:Cytochrome c biosis factor [Bryobacterales bacterium]